MGLHGWLLLRHHNLEEQEFVKPGLWVKVALGKPHESQSPRPASAPGEGGAAKQPYSCSAVEGLLLLSQV